MGASLTLPIDNLADAVSVPGDASNLCIVRSAADDVTDAFLHWAGKFAAAGVAPLIVCADDVAADRYRARLPQEPALGADAVATMDSVCLGIVADERVSAAIGRDARVIDRNEYDVLMEDVKVSGLKPRRLREMLKFFNRSLSEYADEGDGWLITNEEQTVFAILEENLEVRRALLPSELAGQAYRGMRAAGVAPRPRVVLTDDFGSLSKASQRLLRYLATEGLIAAGTELASRNACEQYPYVEGFRELMEDESFLTVCVEPGAGAAGRGAETSFTALESPLAEFAFVADAVARVLGTGTDPSEVLVAVPNNVWGRHIASALEDRGVKAAFDTGSAKVKGDPRTPGKNGSLKLAAFLKLVQDPRDMTALRSWLGMGDWLLRSEAFLELMAYARDHACSVHEAIAELRLVGDEDRPSRIFGKFDAPLDELDELRESLEGASPEQARRVFERHGMALTDRQAGLLGNGAVADMARLASEAFLPPAVPADAVTVAPYARCHGRHVRATFVTGMVNGFLPAADAVDDRHTIDHKKRAIAREEALFADVRATASDKVACSLFKRDRVENTVALPMQPTRVFVKEGMRYADIAPSEFSPEARAAKESA